VCSAGVREMDRTRAREELLLHDFPEGLPLLPLQLSLLLRLPLPLSLPLTSELPLFTGPPPLAHPSSLPTSSSSSSSSSNSTLFHSLSDSLDSLGNHIPGETHLLGNYSRPLPHPPLLILLPFPVPPSPRSLNIGALALPTLEPLQCCEYPSVPLCKGATGAGAKGARGPGKGGAHLG